MAKVDLDTVKSAVYRKITFRLLPFLFAAYCVSFIDRTNIGYAKLQFMDDLGITPAHFGMITAVFYIGYVIFELPSNLLMMRIGGPKTFMRIMVMWGAVTCALMLANGPYALYVLRFLLGVAEAGFFPGVLLYLSFWFPNQRRGRALSLFILAVPIAGMVGGPFAGWVMQSFDGSLGLRGWQWLFFLEGPPAILLGLLAYLLLPKNPQSAAWLSDLEKTAVLADLTADSSLRGHVSPKNLIATLKHPTVWFLASIYFELNIFITNRIWFPTLLKSVGSSSLLTVGWIDGAISVVSAIAVFYAGRSSDYFGDRRWHLLCFGVLACAGFLILPFASHDVVFTAILLAIAMVGAYGLNILFWTIPPYYLEGNGAAAGFAIIGLSGAFGSAVGPAIVGWIFSSTGNVYMGFAIAALVVAVAAISAAYAVWGLEPNAKTDPVQNDSQQGFSSKFLASKPKQI